MLRKQKLSYQFPRQVNEEKKELNKHQINSDCPNEAPQMELYLFCCQQIDTSFVCSKVRMYQPIASCWLMLGLVLLLLSSKYFETISFFFPIIYLNGVSPSNHLQLFFSNHAFPKKRDFFFQYVCVYFLIKMENGGQFFFKKLIQAP